MNQNQIQVMMGEISKSFGVEISGQNRQLWIDMLAKISIEDACSAWNKYIQCLTVYDKKPLIQKFKSYLPEKKIIANNRYVFQCVEHKNHKVLGEIETGYCSNIGVALARVNNARSGRWCNIEGSKAVSNANKWRLSAKSYFSGEFEEQELYNLREIIKKYQNNLKNT